METPETGPRAPAALRRAFARLIKQLDLQPADLGRKLGYRGNDPGAMVRYFIEGDGDKDLTLGRTVRLAELCNATLRVVPRSADAWGAAIIAIEELEEMNPDVRGEIIAMIERARDRTANSGGLDSRQRRRASGE